MSNIDYQCVVDLFNNTFYFQTPYPTMVSAEELFSYLSNHQTLILKENHTVVGLAFYKVYDPQYVFTKIKLIEDINCLFNYNIYFQKLIKAIKDHLPKIHRIETIFFDFESKDIKMIKQLNFKQEIIKKNEIFKDGEFRNVYIFALVDKEIDDYLMGGEPE